MQQARDDGARLTNEAANILEVRRTAAEAEAAEILRAANEEAQRVTEESTAKAKALVEEAEATAAKDRRGRQSRTQRGAVGRAAAAPSCQHADRTAARRSGTTAAGLRRRAVHARPGDQRARRRRRRGQARCGGSRASHERGDRSAAGRLAGVRAFGRPARSRAGSPADAPGREPSSRDTQSRQAGARSSRRHRRSRRRRRAARHRRKGKGARPPHRRTRSVARACHRQRRRPSLGVTGSGRGAGTRRRARAGTRRRGRTRAGTRRRSRTGARTGTRAANRHPTRNRNRNPPSRWTRRAADRVAARNDTCGALEEHLTRRVKRALQDEQNLVLDRLRSVRGIAQRRRRAGRRVRAPRQLRRPSSSRRLPTRHAPARPPPGNPSRCPPHSIADGGQRLGRSSSYCRCVANSTNGCMKPPRSATTRSPPAIASSSAYREAKTHRVGATGRATGWSRRGRRACYAATRRGPPASGRAIRPSRAAPIATTTASPAPSRREPPSRPGTCIRPPTRAAVAWSCRPTLASRLVTNVTDLPRAGVPRGRIALLPILAAAVRPVLRRCRAWPRTFTDYLFFSEVGFTAVFRTVVGSQFSARHRLRPACSSPCCGATSCWPTGSRRRSARSARATRSSPATATSSAATATVSATRSSPSSSR